VSRAVGMLSAAAIGFGVTAGSAGAATPFTVGTGQDPSIAVGSDGTGHAVWATPNPTSVGYCRVSAGAEACNRSELLAFPGGADAQTTGRPVVFTPVANKVVIVAGCWNCGTGGTTDRIYRWISTNNGASFGVAVAIGTDFTTEGAGTWLDAEGIFVGASGPHVKAAVSDTFDGVEYATGGTFVFGPQVTRVPGTNKLVAVTNDLDVVKYGVYDSPLSVPNINNPLNWTVDQPLVAAEGNNSDTSVNSGPQGVYMAYRYFVPNDERLGVRRFDSATNSFGPPTYLEGADAIEDHGVDYPDSFQDPSGRLHLVWRSLYDGGRLRYRVSDASATSFTAAANLARQESFFEPEVAAGADGRGFATWASNTSGGIVRVVPLDPQPEPVTPPAGGGTTTPSGGGKPSGGGSKRSLPVSFTGPGSRLSAKIVGNRVRIRARGTIRLPAGAPRSACSGRLKLAVKRKRTTLATRRAKLKRRNGRCRFGKTIFIKRSKVGRKTTSLRLKLSFRGNAVLAAGSTTKTLVIKK
jgi:hypothetical protein